MKSQRGLFGLFVAWLLATLFVATFFNGARFSSLTPSLTRAPITLSTHDDVIYVKPSTEAFNTHLKRSMAAPAPTSAPAPINEEVIEVEVEEQELQLWQECIQNPAKRDEVYATYLNKARRLKLIGDASETALGAHLARVRAFIEQFNKGESNDTKLSFKTFCDELGLGIDAAKTLIINGTNVKRIKNVLGENPDKTLQEIAQDFVQLSNTNIFHAIMADESAATTIHTDLIAQKLKKSEPTKAIVDVSAYPSIPSSLKKEIVELQGKKKQRMNNPQTRKVLTAIDKSMRKQNKKLHAAQSAVAYQKLRRKSDLLLVAESIQKHADLYFDDVCEGIIEDLPKRFTKICIALRNGDDATLNDESESIDEAEPPANVTNATEEKADAPPPTIETTAASVPPSLEPLTPANIPSEEKTSEVPPPPMNATSAATEPPATEASDFPPNGTDLNGGTAPPVEMAIVDRDDATGIMTGVTSALGGLMSSVFGTSDEEASVLTATTVDEGKKAYPAKNFSVGQRATFGGHNLVVKSRSDGVHFWRRL